ncbi:general transcription repressor [Cladochytrium tenue]|nr:general transcription repressor [Cladochytrium tenue]
MSHPPTADAVATTPPGPLRPSRPPVVATGTCRHTLVGHHDFVLTVGFAGTNASLGRVSDRGEPVSAIGSEALAEVEWVVSGSKDKHVTFWDARRAAPSAAAASRGGNGDAPTPPDPMAVAQLSLRGHDNSIISLSLSSSGGLFATGSGDSRARIWRLSAASASAPTGPPAKD